MGYIRLGLAGQRKNRTDDILHTKHDGFSYYMA